MPPMTLAASTVHSTIIRMSLDWMLMFFSDHRRIGRPCRVSGMSAGGSGSVTVSAASGSDTCVIGTLSAKAAPACVPRPTRPGYGSPSRYRTM